MTSARAPFAPRRIGSTNALVAISALYLAASAFGVLRVPGLGLTYANLALILLGVACVWVGRFGDIRPFFYLATLMALDLLFRAYLSTMGDIGYSVNIGKMALFALIAPQLAASGTRGRSVLAITFGVAALGSELFALAYPSYREELYNSLGILAGIDDAADDADDLANLLYRPTGLIGDPNYFAIPLVLMAAALFSLRRYGWFFAVAVLVATTGSRAAMVALFLPIAVRQLFDARTRPLRFIVYLLCCLGVFVLAVSFNELLRGDTADSNTERAMLVWQGIDNVLSLSFLHATYGQPLGLGIGGDALVVHNTYLQTAVTSALLAIYLVYRSVTGMVRSPNRLVLATLIIEMQFLDVSSFSSILFAFFIFSEGSRIGSRRPDTVAAAPRPVPRRAGGRPAGADSATRV